MDELVGAITKLSEDQTGALITFERRQSLIDYINTGTKINADIKAELFTTIFGKELLFMMEQRSLKGIGLSVRPPFIHPPIRN